MATLSPWDQMFRAIKSASGEQKWIRAIAQPRRLSNGDVLWDGLFIDVTNAVKQDEQSRALEAKWRQVQKMESLGTLAGGITHEFNNMLMPIMTLAEITMRGLPEDGRAHKNLATIISNCKRAAELIEKILSLSRRNDVQRTAIRIADIVAESVDLLQATTPATITVHSSIDRSVGAILADETQILQVMLNLASNARHAMAGKVGELTIDLRTAVIKSRFEGRYSSLEPGTYAKLSVKDTGSGMNETVMRRIFEPFFTTKDVGRGTGMGLAMIHTIVTGLGGAVDVTSTPGGGTTFDVYFPLLKEDESAVALIG
jgi:signal transduction histidine kinase